MRKLLFSNRKLRFPTKSWAAYCLSLIGVLAITSVSALAQKDSPIRDSAPPEAANTTNVVYVQLNDPTLGQNRVLAYRRNATTGCLTELGSYKTGGIGNLNVDDRLGTDDHDQELVISRDKRFLFTVNSGSNTIAVFRINSDGSLVLVQGAPFSSGGISPVSIGLVGTDKLYVVNQNADPGQLPNNARPNYTGFTIDAAGRLTPIPNSTVELARGDIAPTQALISPDGQFLFGNEFFAEPYSPQLAPFLPARSSLLDAFRIRPNGQLQRVVGTPMALPQEAMFGIPAAKYALGLQVHPTQRILYVGFLLGFKIGVYTYDNQGRLTFVNAAPLSDQGPCWIVINNDATRMYVTNAITNSVSVLDISNPLAPRQIQSLSLRLEPDAPPGPFPPVNFAETAFQLALSADGESLYVKTHDTTPQGYANGNALHILRVQNNGRLVERACSPAFLPIPPNAHAAGVAAL